MKLNPLQEFAIVISIWAYVYTGKYNICIWQIKYWNVYDFVKTKETNPYVIVYNL